MPKVVKSKAKIILLRRALKAIMVRLLLVETRKGQVQNGEVQVVVKLEDRTAYGATAPGFFEERRGSVPDPGKLAPSRHPILHFLMKGIVDLLTISHLNHNHSDVNALGHSLRTVSCASHSPSSPPWQSKHAGTTSSRARN